MKEGKLRIYGIIFMMIFAFTFIFAVLIHDIPSGINILAISLIFACIFWELSRWVVLQASKVKPGLKNTKNRIILILKLLFPCALLLPILEMEMLQIMHIAYFTFTNYYNYLFYFSIDLICIAVIVALYESIYYIENWKIQYDEIERIKETNIMIQYKFLKDQIKPHFLFNSLNTLAHLIHSNPPKAEQYVEEMSTVYRYLLSKKEVELSSLKEEINFLNSYIMMLETRFGNALKIEFKITECIESYLIPPFVLQLLLENAVKHNHVSNEHPLLVKIETEKVGFLSVTNNIHKKNMSEASEKTGLINLITRYKLLNRENELLILNDEKCFKVILPLIPKPA